jgi:pimeloyl-ACP methyl ester carboxylesterase
VRVHRRHRIEEPLARLRVPLLVIRGRDDALSGAAWARRLTTLVTDGRYVEVPGAHTFPWRDPYAWSQPVRRFATGLSGYPQRLPARPSGEAHPDVADE